MCLLAGVCHFFVVLALDESEASSVCLNLGVKASWFLPSPTGVGGLCFGAVQIPGHKSGYRRFLLPLLHQQQWFCLCVQVWREFLHPPQRWADFVSLILTEAVDFWLVLEARVFLPSLSGLRLWLCKRSLWEGLVLVFWRQLVTPCVSIWWRRTLSDLFLCLWLCCEHPVQVYRKELEGECRFPCLRLSAPPNGHTSSHLAFKESLNF